MGGFLGDASGDARSDTLSNALSDALGNLLLSYFLTLLLVQHVGSEEEQRKHAYRRADNGANEQGVVVPACFEIDLLVAAKIS